MATSTVSQSWGDQATIQDQLPKVVEGEVQKDGTKTVEIYDKNSKGEFTKTVAKFKVVRTEVPVRVQERQARLRPFGLAAIGNDGCTMVSADDVFVERPSLGGGKSDADITAQRLADALARGAQKPRSSESGAARFQKLAEQSAQQVAEAGGATPGTTGGSTYVPPHAKGGAPAGATDEGRKLRLTNVDEMIPDHELRAFCGRFGNVERCHIVKSKKDGRPIGVAYVTFSRRKDAQEALEGIDGQGLGNMVLRAQEATPSANSGGFGGGMKHATGYGGALPQGRR